MAILWTIIIGLVIGAIAKPLMPGKDPGFIVTVLLGIAGAFLAGILGRAMHWYGEGQPVGFIVAVLGAVLLLVFYQFLPKNGLGSTTLGSAACNCQQQPITSFSRLN